MKTQSLLGALILTVANGSAWGLDDDSPLAEKAAWFQQDLLDKHWLDGLYVSIVPSALNVCTFVSFRSS